jgi:hypothetical protein
MQSKRCELLPISIKPVDESRVKNELHHTEEEEKQTQELLARFGDKAGKHGALAAITVMVPIRLPRDKALNARTLARRLGMKRATWAAQIVAIAADCEPERWFRAVAAFQRACGKGAPDSDPWPTA